MSVLEEISNNHQYLENTILSLQRKVVCVDVEEELRFLHDLPEKCNILLRPSQISATAAPCQSPFQTEFVNFLQGKTSNVVKEVISESPPSELPGKKKYIPPYAYAVKTTPINPKMYMTAPSPNPELRSKQEPQPTPVEIQFKEQTITKLDLSSDLTEIHVITSNNNNEAKKTSPKCTPRNKKPKTNIAAKVNTQNSTPLSLPRPQSNKAKRAKPSQLEKELSPENLPKRETSSRKAKEMSSSRKEMLNNLLLDEDEEVTGLDLSDSDDDATWTPFKEKESSPFGNKVDLLNSSKPLLSKHRRVENNDSTPLSKKVKKDVIQQTSGSPLPSKNIVRPDDSLPRTKIVLPGQNFKNGDFVIIKVDENKDSFPIWRMDSKTLLQRYNPEQTPTGETVYKVANLFSGFAFWERARYISVAVQFVSIQKKNETVKIIQKEGDKVSVDLRKKSLAETSKYQENFDVYAQALISQCLDPDFLVEVLGDQDEYFVSNIEKIDNLVKEKKSQLTNKVLWSIQFKQALTTLPEFNSLEATQIKSQICDGCNLEHAKSSVQLSGKAYSSITLKKILSDNSAEKFNLCQKCNNLSLLFHRLVHQKLWMSKICSEAVTSLKKASPESDTALILNKILENDEWLEQQFKKVQDLWANVDACK